MVKVNRKVPARKRPVRARAAVAKAKKANMKKFVKTVVSELTETKEAYTGTGNTPLLFNSGIDSVGDIQPIIPAMGQGTDTNQRVGQQIRARRLTIKGHVKLNINNTAGNSKLPNVICRLMVVSMKNKSSYGDVTASALPLATLLRKGGSTVGFTGLLSDVYAPINTDVFTVHHDKKIYLSQSYINAIGPSVPSQYVTQDISKTVKFFNINIKCKNKLLKYDEDISSDSWPTNYSPFLVLGYSYLDGSVPDTLSTQVGLIYDSMFQYEDA